MVLSVLSCSTPRFDVEDLKVPNLVGLDLPLESSLVIYIAPSRTDLMFVKQYKGSDWYSHDSGSARKLAAVEVTRHYFSDVSDQATESRAQFILMLSGDANISYFAGIYKVTLEGALYTGDGELIYQGRSSDGVMSAVLHDPNAYYNAYAKSMQDFLNRVFTEYGDKIAAYAEISETQACDTKTLERKHMLTSRSSGSGFILNNQGQVATVYRNVLGCYALSVLIDGQEYPVTSVLKDDRHWIAVMDTEHKGDVIAYLPPLAGGSPLPGEFVMTEAHSGCHISNEAGEVFTGKVIAKNYRYDLPTLTRFTANTTACHQGALLLDENGAWAGMMVGDMLFDLASKVNIRGKFNVPIDVDRDQQVKGSPVRYGINADYIRSFLEEENVEFTITPTLTADKSFARIQETLRRSTAEIRCYF